MVRKQVNSPLDSRFEQLVHRTLEKWHVPGVSVAVVDGDHTWAKGYGIATFPSTPVTPSTLFYAGSTTKAFTAAIIATLVEDNDAFPQVQWDTPVSELIREDFVLSDEYATQHITIEDILSHRTGLPRHDQAYGNSNNNSRLSREDTVRELVRQIRYLPMTAPPRTKYQYCNLMFVVAAHIIQTLTGEWLGDLLARRIWGPLEMDGTFFSLEDAQNAPQHLANGYAYGHAACSGASDAAATGNYRKVEWMKLDEASGAGGIVTNVLDYAKWARSLMSRDSPLSKEVLKAIWEPRTIIPAEDDAPWTGTRAYALGWATMVYRGHELYEHSGGMNAFGAELILIPKLQYSVVVLGNTALTSNFAAQRLAFYLIDEKLRLAAPWRFDWDRHNESILQKEKDKGLNAMKRFYPSLPSPPLPTTLPLSAYAGTYSHPGYQTVTIYLDEMSPAGVLRADRAFTTWPEYMTFEHVSGEYFLIKATGEGDFSAFMPTVYAAEFRLGADGLPSELGITWEAQMKGDKIWLKRV